MQAVVVKSTGKWYLVYSNNQYFHSQLRGVFRKEVSYNTNPIAVGDHVEIELEEDKKAIITHIYDRKNYIIRKSTNLSKQRHILASNIDKCFLLITLKLPRTLTAFIDRILITAHIYNIPLILLFNKIDLYNKEDEIKKEELSHYYKKIGYECLSISAEKKINLNEVKEKMKEKTSMIIGHSGAGKSTLINALSSHHNLRVGTLSESYKKGKHTTTFAQMYPWDFGGWIIDTPGIKSFGIADMTKEEIRDGFTEFLHLEKSCFYDNCLHIKEPDCMVKKNLAEKKIAPWRYKNYLHMIEDQSQSKTPYRMEDWT